MKLPHLLFGAIPEYYTRLVRKFLFVALEHTAPKGSQDSGLVPLTYSTSTLRPKTWDH